MEPLTKFRVKDVIRHALFSMVHPNNERRMQTGVVWCKICHLDNDVGTQLPREVDVSFKEVLPVTLGWCAYRAVPHVEIWSGVGFGTPSVRDHYLCCALHALSQ